MLKLATLLSMALAITATPLSPRTAGDVTYYKPGLGACGQQNTPNDYVAAVGKGIFDAQHPCGRTILVHNHGRSINVRVVDRCGGCADGDLDLSPAAFRDIIGSTDIGRAHGIEWEWA